MKPTKRTLNAFTAKLTAPEAHFYAFVIFFVVVFFTGGGSRDDIQSLFVLRPLAVLFCAYALTTKPPGRWTGRMFPLYVLGALLALMVLQLIPLPPSIWTEFPGRQLSADIANIAGIEQPWRPLTLSPSKTLNSLFSLAVPIAAIMLYLNLDREYRKRTILVFIILCVISALWAIFQISGPARGPLYLYRITNFGMGVGLFANRNHQAVMLASAIVMLGWYAASLKPSTKQVALKFYGSLATILVFVPLIFVTGSRAGLLLMVPALIFALLMAYFGGYRSERSSKRRGSTVRKKSPFSGRRLILLAGTSAVFSLITLSVLLSRSLAFDRLFSGNDLEELRIELLPTLFTMLKEHWFWGSGFGSFEHLYKIYEPIELLRPSYLNQAHNDWLQYPIEGGVLAIAIVVFAIAWFTGLLYKLSKLWRVSVSARYRGVVSAIVILFLLIASIVDYPLRIPSIMAIFAVLVCVFYDSVLSVQRSDTNLR